MIIELPNPKYPLGTFLQTQDGDKVGRFMVYRVMRAGFAWAYYGSKEPFHHEEPYENEWGYALTHQRGSYRCPGQIRWCSERELMALSPQVIDADEAPVAPWGMRTIAEHLLEVMGWNAEGNADREFVGDMREYEGLPPDTRWGDLPMKTAGGRSSLS